AMLVATCLLGYYASTHLAVNSDTGSMISDRLRWRQAFLEYERAFPQLGDEFHVIIDGVTPEVAESAQRELARRLRERPDLFEDLFLPSGGPFFERNGLLYRAPEELERLDERLARFGDLLLGLERQPTLRGMADVLIRAMREGHTGNARTEVDPGDAITEADALDLRPILVRVGTAFKAQLQGRTYQVSWRDLLSGDPSSGPHSRRAIIIRPRLDYTSPLPAEKAIQGVRELAVGLGLKGGRGVRVRITGSEAIEHEALESAMQSTARAGLAALVAVGIILLLGLRSPRLVIASLLTLIAGLAGTASFAAAAVGRLNLISIAFAILYVGLGIDYALHLCLAYVEARREAGSHEAAMLLAARRVGVSLLLSAVTTAAGFYAFIPTDFSGVSELGLISGTGMFISLVATLTLLPALLTLRFFRLEPAAFRAGEKASGVPGSGALSVLARRGRRWILAVTAVLTVASLAVLTRVKFDQNPMNLSDPESESVKTFRELVEDPNAVPFTVSVLAPNGKGARDLARRLQRLPEVETALAVHDLVPDDQPRKLAILASIARTIGQPVEPSQSVPPASARVDEADSAVADLSDAVAAFTRRHPGEQAGGSKLRLVFKLWRWRLEKWPPQTQARMIEELEESLVGALTHDLEILRASRRARTVRLGDLPEALRSRWIGIGGAHRVQIVPKERLDTSQKLASFVESVRSEEADVTGIPVNDLESGRIAVRALRKAFALALIATVVVLVLMLPAPTQAATILASLLIGAVLTFGASVAMDLPMNFANMITLPLLLGVGVDNGIHVLHRARAFPGQDDNFYATSTARAVLFSTLTTIASFGNLAVSRHYGLASMGRLLTIGMLAFLFCTLLVLPSMLAVREPNQERPPAFRGL
ncbi:MAG: MMPL family transporter, partial [Gemmatimonadales bacterium]